MIPKPSHLRPEYGAQFEDASVVEAYEHRPPYPEETFAILAALLPDTLGAPRAVLDIGCGRGEIARRMLAFADRVDAVDPSEAMLRAGRRLPRGDDPRLRWIRGGAEDAELEPPYALITAGNSLHWMEWDVVLPRLGAALLPGGVLAIPGEAPLPNPWDAELGRIIGRLSTNREYEPYDLIEELEARGLFRTRGRKTTTPVAFAQPLDTYVESFHARNGFSRQRMTRQDAEAFDAEVRRLVSPHCADGRVELWVACEVVWGTPEGLQHEPRALR